MPTDHMISDDLPPFTSQFWTHCETGAICCLVRAINIPDLVAYCTDGYNRDEAHAKALRKYKAKWRDWSDVSPHWYG